MTFSEKDLKEFLKNDQISIDGSVNKVDTSPDETSDAIKRALDPRIYNDLKFDSKFEASRYAVLLKWQEDGKITGLSTQHVDIGKPQQERTHRWELTPGYINASGKKIKPCYYIDDFQYYIDGILIVEDAKGYERQLFINKKKAIETKYQICFFVSFSLYAWYPYEYPKHWENLNAKPKLSV